jgi:hypothetical protein
LIKLSVTWGVTTRLHQVNYRIGSSQALVRTHDFERVEGKKRRGTELTGGLGAYMFEEGGDLHHAHLLFGGGVEAAWLEEHAAEMKDW